MTDESAIDQQLQEQNSKPADDHSVKPQQTTTQHIDNRNQLSTPVLLGFLIVFAAMCLGLTVIGIYVGDAKASAAQAERNSKLAQYQLEEAIKKLEERK